MDLRELRKKVNEMCQDAESLSIPVYILLNGDLVEIEDVSIEDSYVLLETEWKASLNGWIERMIKVGKKLYGAKVEFTNVDANLTITQLIEMNSHIFTMWWGLNEIE